MGQNQILEVRCSSDRKDKSGKDRKCGRFLCEMSMSYIIVNCDRCPDRYRITIKNGQFQIRNIGSRVNDSALLQEEKIKNA